MPDPGAVWRAALKNEPARDILRAILFHLSKNDGRVDGIVDRAGKPPDPILLAYLDGEQSLVRKIRLAIDEADPLGYVSLLAEDVKRDLERKAASG